VIDGHGTGFIPPAMNLSHLTGKQPQGKFMAGPPPASFDWRDYSKVTSVKNQGGCGSCYAFAAIANFESRILVDGAAALPDPDYSENNAKECNYYDWSCSGGNYDELASLFSRKGVVLESCDPYVPANVACKATCPYQKTLTDWRIISTNSTPDTTVLKNYIMTYGPVYTALGVEYLPGFGSYDGSYTINYTGLSLDHAVLIVGWSNNLPPDQKTGKPGDGWIVKNSWGSAWGDEGYFYIHYGAANIGWYSSFVHSWEDYNPNGGIMYYDDGGWVNSWGNPTNTTAWGLCRFTPSNNTTATSVEFWTGDATTDIDVYIYDDFDGSSLSNLLRSQLNYNFSEAGYHQVRLDSPLPLASGDDVIVVVKFTNSADGYPVPVDYLNPPWENNCTYASLNGTDGSWLDLGATYGADVAIRLRTATSYTLTMAVSGNGTTTPAAGSHTYAPMANVPITATPDPGWYFVGWTTPDMSELANASANSTTVTMDKGKTVTASFCQPPLANFTASPTTGCEPLRVNFTDLSAGSLPSWEWSFGDGNNSTAQNPSHTYYAGTYNVTLNVTNACGSDTTTRTGYITVKPTPTASFTANVTDGCKPLTVNFTDTSTGANITAWSWAFGDGNASTNQSPVHTYNTTGIYPVNLTVTNAGNCSDVATDFVTVRDIPAANFTASPRSGYAPLTVSFTDLSTGIPSGWNWAFGDGGNSTQASPTHTYTAVGKYTVNLTVNNTCGTNTTSKTGYITVKSRPRPSGGGGGGGSVKEVENYLSVTLLGDISKYKIGEEGNLGETVEVCSQDGGLIISLGKSTACLDRYGRWLGSIMIKEEISPPPLPENHHIVGKAYKLEPEGATFRPALNLTLCYGDNNTPQYVAEKDIYIASHNSGSGNWSALPSRVDTGNNTVTAPVSHFTTFAIIGLATPPRAEFTITSLDLSGSIKSGEELTATVTAANTGDGEGSYRVNLTINGKVEQVKTVTLAPSATETVTFTISKDVPGIYTVSVDGLRGEFTVTPPSWLNRFWFPMVVVAIALGAILAYLIYQRRGQKGLAG
jgi:PKD repeat protein/C1A family cysteine protease